MILTIVELCDHRPFEKWIPSTKLLIPIHIGFKYCHQIFNRLSCFCRGAIRLFQIFYRLWYTEGLDDQVLLHDLFQSRWPTRSTWYRDTTNKATPQHSYLTLSSVYYREYTDVFVSFFIVKCSRIVLWPLYRLLLNTVPGYLLSKQNLSHYHTKQK